MITPSIAVLIPAYNEETVLKGTLIALGQAGVKQHDIYVVNDRSTDRTEQIARECKVNVYTVPENGGKARAQVQALKHFGLAEGQYDWIIFLDGDTKVDVAFYHEMRKAAIEDPSVALYVGQVKSAEYDHIFSALRAFDYTYGQDVAKHGQSNFNVIFVSPGCSSMYRADVLKGLHIDHMTLAEDMDLTMQVHRSGGKVKYLPDAWVHTQDPATITDYHKQIMRWYRGYWQVVAKHKIFGFTKKQPVDLYMMFLTLDAVLFNRIVWFLGILAVNPSILPGILALDVAFSSLIAMWSAYRTRRWDVLYKFPLYYWISYMNFYAYLRAFVEVILLRKELLAWNKVARYDYSNHLAIEFTNKDAT
jgi:cellulose synthase/poly-beta-1,6-N-acetylglucosamine synthase-like glycosyltransferase